MAWGAQAALGCRGSSFRVTHHIQTSKRRRQITGTLCHPIRTQLDRLSWGHPFHCPPSDHLLLCASSVLSGCRAALGRKPFIRDLSKAVGRGQHPIFLRKPGLPCPSLHAGPYVGAFSPAKRGPWSDLPPHTRCSLPPPPNPLTLTSYPAGSGEHLDFRMTQGYSRCLSAEKEPWRLSSFGP